MTRANITIKLEGKNIYGVIDSSASPENIKKILDTKIKTFKEFENSELFEWINPSTLSIGRWLDKRAFADYNFFLNYLF
jgi:hypothetical protein